MGILNRFFGTPLPTDPLERAMLAHATGAPVDVSAIPLVDDGAAHRVRVVLG